MYLFLLLGYAFVTLSTEVCGNLGKAAMVLLNNLAESASADGFAFENRFAVNVLRELSIRGVGVIVCCTSAVSMLWLV